MEQSQIWMLLAALLGSAFFVQTLRLDGGRLLEKRRSRVRSRRAQRGERDAEKLLRRRGYKILGRQVRTTWAPRMDGEPLEVELRADLMVSRRRRRYVAEVKTGLDRTTVRSSSTRRQLLEYRHAFECDGLLLVDPERGRVHEVAFPGADDIRPRRATSLTLALVSAAVGAMLASWLLTG